MDQMKIQHIIYYALNTYSLAGHTGWRGLAYECVSDPWPQAVCRGDLLPPQGHPWSSWIHHSTEEYRWAGEENQVWFISWDVQNTCYKPLIVVSTAHVSIIVVSVHVRVS